MKSSFQQFLWRHRPRSPRLAAIFGTLAFAILSSVAAATPDTTAPARADFAWFKPISERNIFNTSRAARRSGAGEADSPPRVETVTLYGTFIYDKGPFAFFTGSGSEYQQVLGPGKSIAGYTVVEITGTGVKLANGGKTFELRVGMQLHRVEGGEWQVMGSAGASADMDANSASAAADGSSADESDLVKKLMKQREQDLK